jgi:hypothetical protein
MWLRARFLVSVVTGKKDICWVMLASKMNLSYLMRLVFVIRAVKMGLDRPTSPEVT